MLAKVGHPILPPRPRMRLSWRTCCGIGCKRRSGYDACRTCPRLSGPGPKRRERSTTVPSPLIQIWRWRGAFRVWHTSIWASTRKRRAGRSRLSGCHRTDPHGFFFDTAQILSNLLLREYETAVTIGRRAIALNPGFSSSLKAQLAALGHLGREQEELRCAGVCWRWNRISASGTRPRARHLGAKTLPSMPMGCAAPGCQSEAGFRSAAPRRSCRRAPRRRGAP